MSPRSNRSNFSAYFQISTAVSKDPIAPSAPPDRPAKTLTFHPFNLESQLQNWKLRLPPDKVMIALNCIMV